MSNQSERVWGSILLLLLGGCSFVLSDDMPDWATRIIRRVSFRTAVGTLATAVFVRGITVIPDNPSLATYMCLTGALLGGTVLAAGAMAHQHFVALRDALGLFLVKARELMERGVGTQAAYDEWLTDFNVWYRTVNTFLEEHLSPTDATLFRDLSEGGRYSVRGFNSDHMDYKNTLRKFTANLKGVTDRYLSTKP
jgi:hypothetical protein